MSVRSHRFLESGLSAAALMFIASLARATMIDVTIDTTALLGDPAVLALRYDWRNNAVLCLHNLAAKPCEVTLAAKAVGGSDVCLVNLLGSEHSVPDDRGRHRIVH